MLMMGIEGQFWVSIRLRTTTAEYEVLTADSLPKCLVILAPDASNSASQTSAYIEMEKCDM
jgi:hypothetical protein